MLRPLRNFWMPWATTIVMALFSSAVAQVRYKVVDLGAPKNDNFSMVMSINNQGWTEIMAGNVVPGDFTGGKLISGRALINVDGFNFDLGTLGGPNAWMNWGEINESGQVVGYAETAVPDPNGEDICGFGTHLTCRPFLWQLFHMTTLPTLGGNNGEASAINNQGQIVGMAENGAEDSSCPPGTTNNRIQLPVFWEHGKIQALPTVDGDPDGFAFWNNDHGQAVGFSGTCTAALHAITWEKGIASLLPDLGNGALAWSINNQGQIVGTVGSADGMTQTGALWQKGTLTALGLLPGDFGGAAFGNNSNGQIVGGNWNSNFYWSHAFIWQNGVMTDLNKLFPADSNLYATFAAKVNERGQIGGMAIVMSGPHKGDIHSFIATPVDESIGQSVADVAPTLPKTNMPANVGNQVLRRFGPSISGDNRIAPPR
jgi:probable HAF family extracellular repeat protein